MMGQVLGSILVAVITGAFALMGTIVSNSVNHSKTIYRIEQLEKKQDKHNSLIERMYAAENSINLVIERQNSLIQDINDLKNTSEGK